MSQENTSFSADVILQRIDRGRPLRLQLALDLAEMVNDLLDEGNSVEVVETILNEELEADRQHWTKHEVATKQVKRLTRRVQFNRRRAAAAETDQVMRKLEAARRDLIIALRQMAPVFPIEQTGPFPMVTRRKPPRFELKMRPPEAKQIDTKVH
ncbi:MAG TPA: hypothetical protein VEA69_08030 [Tepidisphaeraceae bacterium]|nr:hypothetical protein [Tepidisphaeraceae bacterium]